MEEIDPAVHELYRIKQRLGKGAYGIVWQAEDKVTGQVCACMCVYEYVVCFVCVWACMCLGLGLYAPAYLPSIHLYYQASSCRQGFKLCTGMHKPCTQYNSHS